MNHKSFFILHLMPNVLPKKPTKRAVKQIQLPTPVLQKNHSHHGLATIAIILLFLTVGCLAAATLMSEKTSAVMTYAQNLAVRLAESQKQNADLVDQLTNFKTLQALAKKVMAPPAVPADMVWDAYASPNLTLQYPDGYAVVKATNAFPALTIKSDKGRIEIFRAKDFPGGDRVFGLKDPIVTQDEIDNNIPKEFKTASLAPENSKVQPYSVWIYYGTGDETTKAILDQAVGTIKVAK